VLMLLDARRSESLSGWAIGHPFLNYSSLMMA
jgi:hypothetical protein